MAHEVGVWGPFYNPGGHLGPGESRWVEFGVHDSLARPCALSVTASGYGEGDGTDVLKVDDVSVSCVTDWQYGSPGQAWHAGCNVTNTGSRTVTEWNVLVGVIVA